MSSNWSFYVPKWKPFEYRYRIRDRLKNEIQTEVVLIEDRILEY
ncbi:hypothetical protein ZPR_1039 [Zunongwangia profunda SM-A87]|uniref:Uncharacterized protein n=1 Tax=Zunongwangia profunda (strain DSM 18752 / CCTCC AB 206139 / SM-A87) TaxID=655815 RepID=D5BHZ6_ZUNPS|nr:hypothetical protein ZPR_1039 [Zunongwangia profunda SM-A87]